MRHDEFEDDARRVPDREDALGGADAVEKTTYLGAVRGGETEDPRDRRTRYTAVVPRGYGMGILAWATAVLAVGMLLTYLVGIF